MANLPSGMPVTRCIPNSHLHILLSGAHRKGCAAPPELVCIGQQCVHDDVAQLEVQVQEASAARRIDCRDGIGWRQLNTRAHEVIHLHHCLDATVCVTCDFVQHHSEVAVSLSFLSKPHHFTQIRIACESLEGW